MKTSEQESWRLLALSSVKPKKYNMKVLCIKDCPLIGYAGDMKAATPEDAKIFFGETYTVVQETVGYHGHQMYVLEERNPRYRYRASYFAPSSGITNEEIEEEYQEQEATILDRELKRIVHEFENA